MGLAIEAIVPIINSRAHGMNDRAIAEIRDGIGEFPVGDEIVLFDGHTPEEAERALMHEYNLAEKRDGSTVFVVAGGDGSMQKVRNLFAATGETHDNVIFLHVPMGFVNGNESVFGVKLRSDAIHSALTRGRVLSVDHMAVTMSPDFGQPVTSLALLSIGVNDTHMLKRVEDVRTRGGSRLAKLVEGAKGIADMDPVGVTIRDASGVIYQDSSMLTETIGGQKLLHVPMTTGSLTDGWMTTLVVPAEHRVEGVARAVLGMIAGAAGMREANPYLVQVSGAAVQIVFDRPVPTHVDGEIQQEVCALDIICVPGGTRFLVP